MLQEWGRNSLDPACKCIPCQARPHRSFSFSVGGSTGGARERGEKGREAVHAQAIQRVHEHARPLSLSMKSHMSVWRIYLY